MKTISAIIIFLISNVLWASGPDFRCGNNNLDILDFINSRMTGVLSASLTSSCEMSSPANQATKYIKALEGRIDAVKDQIHETRTFLAVGEVIDQMKRMAKADEVYKSLFEEALGHIPGGSQVYKAFDAQEKEKITNKELKNAKSVDQAVHNVVLDVLESLDEVKTAFSSPEFINKIICKFQPDNGDETANICRAKGYELNKLNCQHIAQLNDSAKNRIRMKKFRSYFAGHLAKSIYVESPRGFVGDKLATARFEVEASFEYENLEDDGFSMNLTYRRVHFNSVASEEVLCKLVEDPKFWHNGKVKAAVKIEELGFPVLVVAKTNGNTYWQNFNSMGNQVGTTKGAYFAKKIGWMINRVRRNFTTIPLRQMTEHCR